MFTAKDADVTDLLHQICADEGIEVQTNVRITRVEGLSGKSVKVFLNRDGTETVVEGMYILAASGGASMTNGIGLELAGVETSPKGHVKVNERLETTAPRCLGAWRLRWQSALCLTVTMHFRIVRDNLAGGNRVTTGRLVPFCVH